jgi:putative PIN family toxin of toxin-antitoxin system
VKPTIVVDTNLFIAGRWNPHSHSNRIIDLVLEDTIDAVYTYEIKDENLFILDKVNPSKDFLDKVIRYYQHARKVVPRRKVNICPDPSDNRYLEAAEVAKANYIITSDHHLLDLGFFAGARIVKPGEFMRSLIDAGGVKVGLDSARRRGGRVARGSGGRGSVRRGVRKKYVKGKSRVNKRVKRRAGGKPVKRRPVSRRP